MARTGRAQRQVSIRINLIIKPIFRDGIDAVSFNDPEGSINQKGHDSYTDANVLVL